MIFIFTVVLLGAFFYVSRNIKDRVYRYFYYLFLSGFSIYSGFGIFTEYEKIQENAFLYLLQFILFIVLFFLGSQVICKYRVHFYMKDLDLISSNTFIYVLAIIYICTFIYKCIFSGVSITDFFHINDLFTNYTSTPFATRVSRNNNVVYTIITNQISSITMPFFYIALYNIRKKHLKFIILYCIPIILSLLADKYLSRNKIAVYLVFIFIFFIEEELISKRVAKIIVCIAVPTLLFIMALLENIRSGFSFNGNFGSTIKEMISSEMGYPQYYDACASKSKDVSVINFLIYIVIVCIPSQIYKIFGFTIPNLAYSFTEEILGLSYGQSNNYYILLPSVLGEAIMLFGKYFAFVYGFIYGALSTWFLKILKEHRCLKYLMIYYLLDFFRQFRGGSQYVISVWETQLIPLIIIIAIYITVVKKRGKYEYKSFNNYSNI